MHETIINLHMHTPYSDGHRSHMQIAQAALKSEVDVVIVTDHNVLVQGLEAIYKEGTRRVLLMVGEEIHDQARQPQKNHLLVIGAERELAPLAPETQRLLNTVRQVGGLSFIAHPVDPPAPAFGEDDLSWVDWTVQGFTGLELWNQMSEFKSLMKSRLHALYYALNPRRVARGPFPEALRRWDELLSEGRKVAAVGGADAHGEPIRLGPFTLTVFPFEFHFQCINNHALLSAPLTGDPLDDRRLVLEALGAGRSFIGYDLPASTRGFRFNAQGRDQTARMGEEISCRSGVTLQVRLPRPAEARLVKDGKVIKTWHKRETCTHITTEPGVYRVEVYLEYLGRLRGWIFSNPIYVYR